MPPSSQHHSEARIRPASPSPIRSPGRVTQDRFNAGRLTPQVNEVSFEILDRPYRLHRASLVAQRVNNLPLTQETWVGFQGREDTLENGMTAHSSILAGEFRGQRSLVGYSLWGHRESDVTERLTLSLPHRLFDVYIYIFTSNVKGVL